MSCVGESHIEPNHGSVQEIQMSAAIPASGPAVVPDVSSKQPVAKKSKSKPKDKAQRDTRPTKLLPTERITVDRQLAILRAYAAASSHGSKAVTLDEVAGVVGMATTTISLANPFLCSINLISKSDAGFIPSGEVVSFLRAHEWNPDTSSHKLSPIIEHSWFFDAIKPRLSYNPTDEEAIIKLLAETTAAGPDYKKNLQMLIEFTIAAGLVQRDGNQLRLANPSTPAPDAPPRAEGTTKMETPLEPQLKNRVITTAFAKTAEGAVHFNVSVRVDMDEFAGWQPERITAFFAGIAKVLAAKANIETESDS
jgi:hypothetical protein